MVAVLAAIAAFRRRPLMTILFRSVGLGLILALSVAQSLRAADSLSAADRSFLERQRTLQASAMLDGDPDALVQPYAADVRLMPEYHTTVFGRTEARAYHAAFFGRFAIRDYAREPLRFFEIGVKLVEVGRFRMRLAAGNATTEVRGKYIDIWDRSGISPLIVTHGWNFDSYPEIADKLRFPSIPGRITAFEPRVPVNDALSFELAALNKLQESAIVQHDGRLWAQFFAPDATLLPNHNPARQGKEEVDAYLEEHSKQFPVFEKLDIRNDKIDAAGRYVLDYASHIAIWRNGDSSGANTGKNVRIWRREPEGTLRLICQIGMYD